MTDSSQKWIEAGYDLFSVEGPDGVIVEKLARHLGLNKSGFYHHFGDREVFLSRIMEHHSEINRLFYNEALLLNKFYPDYLDLLYSYKKALLVQMHLRRHMENPMFHKEFLMVSKRNEKALLPLWADFLKIPDNHDLAYELWDILRDVFFLRVKKDTLTPEFLYSIVKEFTSVLEVLRKHVAREGGSLKHDK